MESLPELGTSQQQSIHHKSDQKFDENDNLRHFVDSVDIDGDLSDIGRASSSPSKLKLYKRRWYLLLIFSLSAMLTSIFQMSFASIQSETLTYFSMAHTNTNLFKVNMFALSYNLNIVVAFLASFFVKKFGLGPMVDIAITGHFIAAWLRFGGSMWRTEYGFWICLLGQVIAAAMQPSISYSSTLMSLNWFGESERAMATTIASFSNLLGTGVAFALTTMVSESHVWTIWITLLLHAVMASVVAVGGLPFFRSKPPTPANIASMDQEGKNIGFMRDLWLLVTNVNVLILATTFGLGFGCISSFLSLIGQIVSPRGYQGTDASVFGLLVIFCGGGGAIVFGILVDRTKRYRLLMWISGLGALVSLAAFTFLIRYDKNKLFLVLLSVSAGSLGMFALPFVPIVMELACEISYPVSASTSNVVFGSAGTFFTIGFMLILQQLAIKTTVDGKEKVTSMQNAMYVILGSFVLALVVFVFFRGKNRRSLVEQAIRDGKSGVLDDADADEAETVLEELEAAERLERVHHAVVAGVRPEYEILE
mmetsp:Transcript_5309/g.19860  ORF Transcript_5309/g.19860 Transcript_5309/m.19860 type:complete len:536 (-) Transcript_5309:9426-11033(-)|eukprot:CAMPEP_0117446056 /NCGR_PEP_ID=MMETSP0759-20121206/6129_1 /TAXON_ID=63605 /ORGANISM="Percolomonas cosmopolitus, Strain WS" /LENGTH=535 /DNA_ID=CAMNT_0005238281 /DNA_START=140 /DNA_END=1747 /DNA_ORIENTATION=+